MIVDPNENEETSENNEPLEQEQPPEETPETQETPEEPKEGEGPEDAAKASQAAAQEQAKAEEKRKNGTGGWQRKIDRLERELERERQLRDQLAAAARAPANAEPEKPKDAAAQMEEYVSKVVAQRLQAEREQQQQQQAQADFQRRTSEVRAANPDWDEVIQSVDDVRVPPHVQRALLTSKHGPAIMYQLAKNRPELERISSLPDVDALLEIGALAAKVAGTAAPKVTPKPASRPPAPPTNVGGNSSSTRSLDDLPISDYKRAYRSGRR